MKFLYVLFLLPLVVFPVDAQNTYEILPTEQGTLNVGFTTIPSEINPGDTANIQLDFLNAQTNKIQEHIDYSITIMKSGENIFGPTSFEHTSSGSVKIPVEFQSVGVYSVLIEIEGILFQPVLLDAVSFNFEVVEVQIINNEQSSTENGGCLIATAAFGSELAPQVQFLRELRDNTVLQTSSGASFMTGFNAFYYSFSPIVADLERQNLIFKEMIKVAITPMLSSLLLLSFADIDSEVEMLGYGVGVILLNIGMYFMVPAIVLVKISQRIRK